MTNTVIEASLLNRSHIGRKVRVTTVDGDCSDLLRGVSHSADIINDTPLFAEVPSYSLGRGETIVSLLRFGEVHVAGDSLVELFPA
jgi:hypothetical protein